MHLIAPDVLTEARGLTGAMAGTVCVLGIALWVFGWRWHRFWVVAGITLASGLIGLNAGRAGGGNTPVMAIGILLAVSAGDEREDLRQFERHHAGGVGAWLAVQWVLPQAQELWAVFLCGGLFGVLLYRLWTMMLTSLAGTLLAAHAGLLLLEPVLGFNAAAWAAANLAALNGVAVGFTILGVLVQAAAAKEEDEKKAAEEPKDEDDGDDEDEKPKKKPAKAGRKKFRLFGKAA